MSILKNGNEKLTFRKYSVNIQQETEDRTSAVKKLKKENRAASVRMTFFRNPSPAPLTFRSANETIFSFS